MVDRAVLVVVAALVGCGGGSDGTSAEAPAQLTVSTLAGGYGAVGFEAGSPERKVALGSLNGVALDAAGNLYVAHTESHTDFFGYSILKIAPDGAVSALAGSGTGYADGPGVTARFHDPRVGGVDSAGNVYVADTGNNVVRKISPAGVVSTFAGSAEVGFFDGVGTSARFQSPTGLALDAVGNVYVADGSNHAIRKISPAGVVSTLAGNGSPGLVDGSGGEARFYYPVGMAVDRSGTVYVGDLANRAVRKISPTGVVQTLAGSGYAGALNGIGAAAAFASPSGVAVDRDGVVYVADAANNLIRKITPEGLVRNFAGVGGLVGGFDNGPSAQSQFRQPMGVAVDATGTVYVVDSGNGAVRTISPQGMVGSLVGHAIPGYQDGNGAAARFGALSGGAVDRSGNVFVADCANNVIRKVSPAGVVSTFAGSSVAGDTDGTGAAASINCPRSLAIDEADNLYLASATQIRKVSPAGVVTTLARDFDPSTFPSESPNYTRPGHIAIDGTGNIYLTDAANTKWTFGGVWKVTPAGVVGRYSGIGGRTSVDGDASRASFVYPTFLAADKTGTVYVADGLGVRTIRKISPDRAVTTIMADPRPIAGLAADGFGNVFFASGNVIYKLDSAGVVLVVAGTSRAGFADGPAATASFSGISNMAIDRAGRLLVFEYGNNAIRVIAP